MFSDPTRQRIVVELDVRNHLALRRLEMEGFTFDDEIDMPDKRAQLAFLTHRVWVRGTVAFDDDF